MTEKARRRRRRWTLALTAVAVALAASTVAVGVSRQQAASARDHAQAEARRAEAGKLLALARNEIERHPTAALAYARKSLELADTAEGRRVAVEVLWRGPVARVLPVDRLSRQMGLPDKLIFGDTSVSPDGRWLATRSAGGHVLVFPADGGPARSLPAPSDGPAAVLAFSPQGDQLVTGGPGQSLRFLSMPGLRETRRVDLGGVRSWGWASGAMLLTFTQRTGTDPTPLIRVWSFGGGGVQTVHLPRRQGGLSLDGAGRWIAYGRGRLLLRRRIDTPPPAPEEIVGRLDDQVADVAFLSGDALVSADASGETRLWSGGSSRLLEPRSGSHRGLLAVHPGRRLLAVNGPSLSVDLLDLRDPPNADPVRLSRTDPLYGMAAAFDASGAWLATNNYVSVAFWPLVGPWRRTLRHPGILTMSQLSFSPDGRWLASCTGSDTTARARLWPLDADQGSVRVLGPAQPCTGLGFHPDGRQVLVGTPEGTFLVPIPSGPPQRLVAGWEGRVQFTMAPTFDAAGRRAAASPFDMTPSIRDPRLRVLRVWDLASGQGRTYSLAGLTDASWWGFDTLRFAPDGSLLAAGAGAGGVFRLRLPADGAGPVASEVLYRAGSAGFDVSADGRRMLVWASRTPGSDRMEELAVLDLVLRTSRRIKTHGTRIWTGTIDAEGRTIATADIDGVVRVGPISGEEPHLLLGGHAGVAWGVAMSRDGRWIASVGDEAIQLWPMPDLTRPPFHTLPRAELMARLGAFTNLEVVRDPTSASGWRLEVGVFPGWEAAPRW